MLYDRLKQIRQAQKADPASGAPVEPGRNPRDVSRSDRGPNREGDRIRDVGAGHDVAPGPGWRAIEDLVYHRRLQRPSPEAARLFELYRGRRAPCMGVVPPGVAPERLVFFDLETTGLSSGAGSVAFLAGFGRLHEAGVALEQVFMADYPGEPAFLAAVRERIGPGDVMVSYNGRSFDAQVLKTRLLMNGMPELQVAHADLLHPARRLWRRLLPNCSLGSVESSVLGVRRGLDLPGWEVPEAYFDYLRHGAGDRLAAVFAHHEQDIISLAGLLWRLEAFVVEERSAVPVDRFELGRLLTRDGCGEDALRRGRHILHDLLRPNHPDALRAALYLGNWYRRQGLSDDAEAVWQFAYRELKSVEAAVALAKLHEHRHRNPARALEIVSATMGRPHARPYAESLRHRRARLERKLARRGNAVDPT